jgi:hypothetical protein
VPRTLRTLCNLLILVNYPAESVALSDVLDRVRDAVGMGSLSRHAGPDIPATSFVESLKPSLEGSL